MPESSLPILSSLASHDEQVIRVLTAEQIARISVQGHRRQVPAPHGWEAALHLTKGIIKTGQPFRVKFFRCQVLDE